MALCLNFEKKKSKILSQNLLKKCFFVVFKLILIEFCFVRYYSYYVNYICITNLNVKHVCLPSQTWNKESLKKIFNSLKNLHFVKDFVKIKK
jgi:hypothetical protein